MKQYCTVTCEANHVDEVDSPLNVLGRDGWIVRFMVATLGVRALFLMERDDPNV